jgi:glycosyltransferase involved in cell wall biosynthesis
MTLNRKKILLLGKIAGNYRIQNLVKTLLDDRHILSIANTEWYSSLSNSYPKNPNKILAKILPKIHYFFVLIDALLKGASADLIYVLPMNSNMVDIALLLKRIYGIPIISELYISLYDTLVNDTQRVSQNSSHSEHLKKLDRILIEKSDRLIHLSSHELNYISELVGANIDPSKIEIIPLAVEEKLISETIDDPEGIFRLCWWGNFRPLHGLEKIILSIKILKEQNHRVRLDIWGPIKKKDIYVQIVQEMDLSKEIYFHDSDYSVKIQEYLICYCDLALGIFGDSGKAKNAVANKVIDAMAMKLPVLTMDSPCLWEFLGPKEIFTCLNKPEDIAGKIIEIAADPLLAKKTASAGYMRYLETFTVNQYSRKISELVKNIEISKTK